MSESCYLFFPLALEGQELARALEAHFFDHHLSWPEGQSGSLTSCDGRQSIWISMIDNNDINISRAASCLGRKPAMTLEIGHSRKFANEILAVEVASLLCTTFGACANTAVAYLGHSGLFPLISSSDDLLSPFVSVWSARTEQPTILPTLKSSPWVRLAAEMDSVELALWSAELAKTMHRSGSLVAAIDRPGASTPITLALVQYSQIDVRLSRAMQTIGFSDPPICRVDFVFGFGAPPPSKHLSLQTASLLRSRTSGSISFEYDAFLCAGDFAKFDHQWGWLQVEPHPGASG